MRSLSDNKDWRPAVKYFHTPVTKKPR
jgi:hypothetical protein